MQLVGMGLSEVAVEEPKSNLAERKDLVNESIS